MRVSELIQTLKTLEKLYGDIPVLMRIEKDRSIITSIICGTHVEHNDEKELIIKNSTLKYCNKCGKYIGCQIGKFVYKNGIPVIGRHYCKNKKSNKTKGDNK